MPNRSPNKSPKRPPGASSAPSAPLPLDFDWGLIRSFLAVIDAGSLSGAARVLSSTQPTLGRHVEALEEQLGKVLFERTGRGLEPTADALAIAGFARRMQVGADELARAVTGRDDGSRAFVRIAAARQVALHLLPELVGRIQRRAPQVDVGIVASDEVSNLLRREADIAIRNVRPEQSSLIAKKVGEFRVRAFASRAYLDVHGTPDTVLELMEHPLVGADRAPEFHRGLEQAARRHGRDPAGIRVAVRSDDRATQFACVRAGLGIGFSLDGVIARHADLVALPMDPGLPTLPVWLTVHREIRTAPAIRQVFDELGASLKEALAP